MNNFKESLPKSGHVNEVCKEWLVREDGALAYKLQSQEITDFYKGNRFRNAVVREDFPTALHEQIKETEEAAKQAEDYRRRLMEQEEHDKRVAKEIAQKLERDLREQQERDMLQSELIAQQMQEIYVNLPPVPPPASRDKSARPPPRPAKASTLQSPQQQQQSNFNQASSNQQLLHHQHQLQAFSNTDNYVGLSLAQCIVNQPQQTPTKYKTSLASPQPQTSLTSSYSSGSNGSGASGCQYVVVSDEAAAASLEPTTSAAAAAAARHQNGHTPTSPIILTNEHFIHGHPHANQANGRHHHHHHQHSSSTISSTSSSTKSSASGASTSAAAARRNVFDFHNLSTHSPHTQTPPKHHHQHSPQHTSSQPHTPSTPHHTVTTTHTSDIDELIEYSDVADSIRRYDINQTSSTLSSDALDSSLSPSHSSPTAHSTSSRNRSASHENLLRHDLKFQKLSPEKYDQLVGNGGEALMQQHADDIELYVDPCDYASLQEIGLPMEEIKEMSKKLKQEQKDELLARRLQQMEAKDGLTQEERDRLLAIEAQDKELAKMLQEREKAKIKRAKEKARQRKNQQKEAAGPSMNCGSGTSPNGGGLHCGPLLALPQDCMSACNPHAKHYADTGSVTQQHQQHPQFQQHQQQYVSEADDPLDMEAYSNPIDVIQQQQQNQQQQQSLQRPSNGLLTNGSLTRDKPPVNRLQTSRSVNDDDIYTLPVDNCRNGTATSAHNGRPTSLQVVGDNSMVMNGSPHNSMTRSENYGFDVAGNEPLNGHELSSRLSNYSQKPSQTFDQNSSPTPPYMPIQGSRRLHTGDERKKKSKDSKCTHQ